VTKKLYLSKQAVECRPTEQQLLLLQAALLQGEPALAAWRAWRLTADLDQLPPGGFALLPLLAYNLQQHGLSDDLLNKCQGIYRRTWTQNQLRLQAVGALLGTVADAGLTPVLSGDLPLALLYYPAQGLRAINHLHLATPAPQAVAMRTQLTQAGWQPYRTKEDWLARPLLNNHRPQRFRQSGDDLTLHLRRLPPGPEHEQRSDLLSINGATTPSADATDLFLTVCVQGVTDFWRYGAIQWLVDATMLLRSSAATLDWPRLTAQVARQAAGVRMNAALTALQTWVDASIPPAIQQTVATLPIQPFERWEAHLCQRLPGKAGKVISLWAEGRRAR
jgi:hypothetical protein